MRHLGTRPASCGRAAPQPPTRCEDRLPSTAQAQKKTDSRGEDDADAKTHRKLAWYRIHSKEVEGCQEQDKSSEMQTRQDVKLKAHAHGHNDPQLHRPQQQVSILDDLVGEEASMSVTRRRPLATRDKARIGPDVSFSVSLDSTLRVAAHTDEISDILKSRIFHTDTETVSNFTSIYTEIHEKSQS